MKTGLKSKPNKSFLKFIIFIVFFWISGILLAFWYGMGWFLLLQTIRRFIFAVPPLRFGVMSYFGMLEAENGMNVQIGKNRDFGVSSNSSFFQILLYLLGTILVFWKANIPIVDIIDIIIR